MDSLPSQGTTEEIRQLLELTVSCGRSWQSSQTGYIHYSYTIQDEDFHHPIPILENMLFSLALMRSRKADNIAEAKELLNRLLYFQNCMAGASKGNFPVYLHEYPFCKDRFLAIHLLASLYWIHHGFHHVLGSELLARLERSLCEAMHYALLTHREKPAPYHIAVKAAALAKEVGKIVRDRAMEQEGSELLESLRQRPDWKAWCMPLTLSDIVTGLQIAYGTISSSPWSDFWKHLDAVWHGGTASYAGPGWKEFQSGIEPQPALYDYFMGYFSGIYNYRSFFDHPVQLHAALVHPSEDRTAPLSAPVSVEGVIDGAAWVVCLDKRHALALLSKKAGESAPQDKTYTPFKLLWGDKNRVHSLVAQGSRAQAIGFFRTEDGADLEFILNEETDIGDREKSREVVFYFDIQEGVRIRVQNRPATTFQLGEEVLIEDSLIKIGIKFESDGEGQFFGHIMKGNRPSQVDLRGPHRFAAYDWQIFLRTVRRPGLCKIKARVRIYPSG